MSYADLDPSAGRAGRLDCVCAPGEEGATRGGEALVRLTAGFGLAILAQTLVLAALLGQGKWQLIVALVAAQYAYFARTAHGAASTERISGVDEVLGVPARWGAGFLLNTDGLYGPETEARLRQAPATGFPLDLDHPATVGDKIAWRGRSKPWCGHSARRRAGACGSPWWHGVRLRRLTVC